jgi:hypothetical protein
MTPRNPGPAIALTAFILAVLSGIMGGFWIGVWVCQGGVGNFGCH